MAQFRAKNVTPPITFNNTDDYAVKRFACLSPPPQTRVTSGWLQQQQLFCSVLFLAGVDLTLPAEYVMGLISISWGPRRETPDHHPAIGALN